MNKVVTMKQLLDNAVHYGHVTRRWNPKMAPYIYGTHNNVHIINLQKTLPMLENAYDVIKKVVSSGGRVLFVGTKKQVAPLIKEYAEKCGQYYVSQRWLGGMLTNWKTISNSVKKLERLNTQINEGAEGLTKKEKLQLVAKRDKLNTFLGGISTMGGLPNLIIAFDVIKDNICLQEAKKLNIPTIGIVDTNADPDLVNFVVPGNDDAIKSARLYCNVFAQAVIDGLEQEANLHSVDKEYDKDQQSDATQEVSDVKTV